VGGNYQKALPAAAALELERFRAEALLAAMTRGEVLGVVEATGELRYALKAVAEGRSGVQPGDENVAARNLEMILSRQFQDLANAATIGGYAGEGRVAVSGVVDAVGRILALGKAWDLAPIVREQVAAGRLYSFLIYVKKGGASSQPVFGFSADAPMPELARRRLAQAFSSANARQELEQARLPLATLTPAMRRLVAAYAEAAAGNEAAALQILQAQETPNLTPGLAAAFLRIRDAAILSGDEQFTQIADSLRAALDGTGAYDQYFGEGRGESAWTWLANGLGPHLNVLEHLARQARLELAPPAAFLGRPAEEALDRMLGAAAATLGILLQPGRVLLGLSRQPSRLAADVVRTMFAGQALRAMPLLQADPVRGAEVAEQWRQYLIAAYAKYRDRPQGQRLQPRDLDPNALQLLVRLGRSRPRATDDDLERLGAFHLDQKYYLAARTLARLPVKEAAAILFHEWLEDQGFSHAEARDLVESVTGFQHDWLVGRAGLSLAPVTLTVSSPALYFLLSNTRLAAALSFAVAAALAGLFLAGTISAPAAAVLAAILVPGLWIVRRILPLTQQTGTRRIASPFAPRRQHPDVDQIMR
jgi:hypothetical protein